MKRHSKLITLVLTFILACISISFYGCKNETKYGLTVNGSELLYEQLEESYKAGEEVVVKVKITPHENTVAYLDSIPLARAKSSQDEYFTFSFTMPNKTAVLSIENIKGFDEDLLTGFHLTFCDKDNNSIESLNKEFDSSEAVAKYYYSYFDESFGNYVFTANSGADVFADGETIIESVVYGLSLKSFELDYTLYFTYEMLGAVTLVDWVYFDQQTGEIDISEGVGYTLNNKLSATLTQNLSETRYTVTGRRISSDVRFESYDSFYIYRLSYGR